jgi:hypothetical protein
MISFAPSDLVTGLDLVNQGLFFKGGREIAVNQEIACPCNHILSKISSSHNYVVTHKTKHFSSYRLKLKLYRESIFCLDRGSTTGHPGKGK